jgi:hypothetical protein
MARRRITAAARGPTAQPNKPFRFFALPRELRDMVYNEAWPKTPYLHRATLLDKPSPLIDITATYREKAGGWSPGRHIPEWVLVSRAFLFEAMEQYFQNIDWLVKIPGSRFTTRIYLCSSEFLWDSNFFMGNELDDIRMNKKLLSWIPYSDYSTTVIELYKAWPMHMPILKKLERGLRDKDGPKTLHIAFGISFHRDPTVTAVDLSAIEHAGFQVDRVVVNVMCTNCKQRNDLEQTKRLIHAEVERLGRVLVGSLVTPAFARVFYASPEGGAHWHFTIQKA